MGSRFKDRRDAGRALSGKLGRYSGRDDVVVLALPRGGVPVAYEVATALSAPLDVFVVRKLGFPGHEEYAMGAIASGGVRVVNPALADAPALAGQLERRTELVERIVAREAQELARREQLYRAGRPPLRLRERCVILVDDGLATGSTMLAAIVALRGHGPAEIVVAVPVGSPEICAELTHEVDEVVCATTPENFSSVGRWYADFKQTSDGEVQDLLARATIAWAEHRGAEHKGRGNTTAV
jgi:predicted phosphoribosyltransferase